MNIELKRYRVEAGLTQKELANLAGFSDGQRRVSHYETGARKPDLTDCRTLVAAINEAGVPCSLDDVFPPESEQLKTG